MADTVPRHRSFRAVLHNSYDQVLVRDLLEDFVPKSAKKRIVQKFNARMATRNKLVRAINKDKKQQ